jgi:hypothetical protein
MRFQQLRSNPNVFSDLKPGEFTNNDGGDQEKSTTLKIRESHNSTISAHAKVYATILRLVEIPAIQAAKTYCD